ncbi:SDR family oxidoreductase [Allobranchiibius sp. GilTou38]|uniref:SDR family oxidoreductase n=1 Tax=Allobranchiibius sp. GilTou38 TaxID=2815210 RepID=UPI001AA1C2C5|nr:SDR family oxidoreductase [Allobranchiibius sp. GilTou38]MBO1766155.1 SDR family oxidoreductase [Allobranchiibius sp. GilTou38]
MPTYTVTAASGQLGRLAVEELLARGVAAQDVVAVVRTPSKAADLADRGVQVREGDYDRSETMTAALHDADRVLMISGPTAGQRIPQHTNVIEAAKAGGAKRIVYTSILNADDTTNPLAGEHQETERLLRASGVPVVLLRNGWYDENYTGQLDQYLEHGEIVGAAADGRISAAARQDYAVAAVATLLQDESGDRTYELGGSSFDMSELAAVISEVSGRTVAYRDVPAAEYVAVLRSNGLDEGTAEFVANIDSSIAHGDLETHSDALAELIGRPVTPLADVVRAAWSQRTP